MRVRIPGLRAGAGLGVLLAAVALSVGILRADDLDEQAAYVAAVEQAKGHLLASREVYRRGQRVRADVHASHPIQELGYRLWRPVMKVDQDLGARLQGALKEPGRAVDARAPAATTTGSSSVRSRSSTARWPAPSLPTAGRTHGSTHG